MVQRGLHDRQGLHVLRDYVARARSSHRQSLCDLHVAIAAAAPDAVLSLRRSVPAYRYRDRALVSIGDAKHHVSLYVMQGQALSRHAAELARFDTSTTVIRFAPESPIPAELVGRIVRARMNEIEATRSPDHQTAAEGTAR